MVHGIFTLVKYKAELVDGEWVPGEIVDVQEQRNTIQYRHFRKIMIPDQVNFALNLSSTYTPVAFVSALPYSGILNATLAYTSWVKGVQQSAPFWTSGNISTDPPINGFWTTQTRFSVPVSTRYIRSVAIGQNTSTVGDERIGGAFSCVTLTTPCIQGTTEILDVFYRIFVDVGPVADGKVDTSLRMASTHGYQSTISTATGTNQSNYVSAVYTYFPSGLMFEQMKADSIGLFDCPSLYYGGTVRSNTYSSHIDQIFGHRYSVGIPATSANVTMYHGLPIRALSVKRVWQYFLTIQPVSKGTGSSVQNTYHRAANTGNYRRAFLDIDNIGNSTANVIVSDPGTWADTVSKEPFVHHYRIEITQGGLVGTAEYKIRRRRGTGWNYAMYHPMPMTIPTMKSPGYTLDNDYRATDWVRHGQVEKRAQQYLWPEFLTHDQTGITVMHVNGEFENIDADRAIPLPVTDLLQVAPAWSGGTRTGDMFVACGNTGLWKITRSSEGPVTAIDQITPVGIANPNSCRAVTVNSSNGEVWAIFHDVSVGSPSTSTCYMAKSSDQGATWTLYDETTDPQFLLNGYTSGSPGPTGIIGMHISPYNANNEMFIVAPDVIDAATSNNQGFWWSEAGSTPTSNQFRFSTSLQAAGYLKFKSTMHNAATPLHTGQWLFSGPYSNTITSYPRLLSTPFYGSSIASFGGGVTASNISASSGVGRVSIGIRGNLVYHNDATNMDYIIGTTSGVGSGFTSPTSTGSDEQLRARTGDEYSSAATGVVVYTNSPSVNTTSHGQRYSQLEGEYLIHASMLCHIGNGVFLCNNEEYNQPYYFLTFYGDGLVATENNIPWFEEYGWNGSSWEVGNPNSKVTHALDEDLLDTLQIRFDDGTTGSPAVPAPLVTGEYYDTFIYDGILLDDATAYGQTVYNYMHATDPGTIFTPGTVPIANEGARVAEPLALCFNGWDSAETGLTAPGAWGEPGKIIAGTGPETNISMYAEQKLEGDFEFRFKIVQDGSIYIPYIGLVNWSSIEAAPRALSTSNSGHRFHIRYRRTGIDDLTGDLQYTLTIHSGTFASGATVTINKIDGTENDIFAFRRTGTTIEFLINGVVEYTYPTATGQELGIAMWHNQTISSSYLGGWTIYDGEIDYTVNRKYVEVGNGVSTGARDINFQRLIQYRVSGLDLNVSLDGTPAVLLNDGITPPGPGEVNILPCSGRIWFNDADAGRAITGNWRILKKLNLE